MIEIQDVEVDGDFLPVLTTREIHDSAKLYIADFRDSQCLVFIKSGNYICFSKTLGMVFGKGTPILRNGIWVCQIDKNVPDQYRDFTLSCDSIDFEMLR